MVFADRLLSLYSAYTVSPTPKKSEGNSLAHWFGEPAHYKAELGEVILSGRCLATVVR